MPLDEEMRTYEQHRDELLGRARDKFVLIKGARIVDVFDTANDALARGYDEFGAEPFLVKQIVEVEIPMTLSAFQRAV